MDLDEIWHVNTVCWSTISWQILPRLVRGFGWAQKAS